MSFQARKHKCRLALNADQSLNNDTATLISWARHLSNPNGMHNLSVNPERVTIQQAGLYHCVLKVNFAHNTSGYRTVMMYHKTAGGTTVAAPILSVPAGSAHATYGLCLILPVYFQMAEGDYILPYATQTSGGALAILGASADDPATTHLYVAQQQ